MDLETELDGSRRGEGNTHSSPKVKQVPLRKHHFFTWNNYSGSDGDDLDGCFRSSGAIKWLYQTEICPTTGTRHLQGIVSFPKEIRSTAFSPSDKIHWEKPRNVEKCYIYCKKLTSRDDEYKCWSHGIKIPYVEVLPCIFPWQQEIIDIIKSEPDDRTIHWYWSEKGGAGKSRFQKYVKTNFPGVTLQQGNCTDMKNGIIAYEKRTGDLPTICLLDIPKCTDLQYISYSGLEAIKNMCFYSGKYEGGEICGKCPHVIIFANQEPESHKMSSDRWRVVKID